MLGFHLIDEGLEEEAIRFHELNVETNPTSFEAVFWLADAYATVGSTERAIAAFENVLNLDPPKTGTVIPYYTDSVEMLRVLTNETDSATLLR